MPMHTPDLDHLILKASATALVYMRGEAVISMAGDLSDEGVEALMSALQRYWLDVACQEFNRYVGLSLDGQFHILFAKFLPQGENLLGLVFPLQTPLIRVRQDMTDILRSIMVRRKEIPTAGQPLERSLQFGYQPTPHPDQQASPQGETGWRPERDQQINQDDNMPQLPDATRPPKQSVSTASESRKRYLTFGAPLQRSEDEPLFANRLEEPDVLMEELPWQPLDEEGNQYYDFSPLEDSPEVRHDLVDILHENVKPEDKAASAKEWHQDRWFLKDEELVADKVDEDTAPMSAAEDAEKWEEVIGDVTFCLVPRRDGHHLIGELSQRLRTWLPAICEKYGWELGFLSVRPEYLKWTLRDFPESLISEMLHILRKETSRRIFECFPEYKEGNQCGDVWAPGYLVDLQHREFTTQTLMAHIAETRLKLNK